MDAFTFDALPGRVVFGVGVFDRVPEELDRLGLGRILLIADRSAGAWAAALRARLGVRVVAVVDDVRVHVPLERAIAARDLATASAVDGIVTVGGGSATGLGKAVALTHDVSLVAIPTTYAGSEMTPIWGITSAAHKETGRDPRVQPRLVIYDPRLTLSLPPPISGPSGMNALAHCVEALYADGANPITSLMAEKGIRVLACGLPRIVATPDDLDARSEVLAGAYLAGASFAAAGSSIHHKICHILGGAFDLPHAEMHTVVLPQALAFVAPHVPGAIARMAAALGEDDVPGAVYDLAVRIGAPVSLAAIGLPGDRLGEATTLVVDGIPDSRFPVGAETMGALLAAAYRGIRPSRPPSDQTGQSADAARPDPNVPAIPG